jgi:hypothetical protein
MLSMRALTRRSPRTGCGRSKWLVTGLLVFTVDYNRALDRKFSHEME